MKEYVVKVFEDGSRCWYLDGERHREDGPAVEFSNGNKVWYLNGERVTEEEHKRRTTKTLNTTPQGQALRDAWCDGYKAAMELLDALENLRKVHEGKDGTQYNAADIARAAIAKAKGEE